MHPKVFLSRSALSRRVVSFVSYSMGMSRTFLLEIVLVFSIFFVVSYRLFPGASFSHLRNSMFSFEEASIPVLFTEAELAKFIRVYVYELPPQYNIDMIKRDSRCLTRIFASEIHFHSNMLASPLRTLDPSQANWFYIPVYSTSLIQPDYLTPMEMHNLAIGAINYVAENFPYWKAKNGTDHFVITPHDYGSCFNYVNKLAAQTGIPPWLESATLIQTFGHRSHPCMREGSIIIPPYVFHLFTSSFFPQSIPKRDIFIYFRGRVTGWNVSDSEPYSRDVRLRFFNRFQLHPLFQIHAEGSPDYLQEMRRSVFCLCPLGWTSWSPRLVESIVSGCIPVIIADDIVLPFENIVPWKRIAVFVAEKNVEQLDNILAAISLKKIKLMQELLANPIVQNAVIYRNPPEMGDAYHLILRELALKLYPSNNSPAG